VTTLRPGRLEGRAALVTGAADGIGLGIARRFADEGAAVLVVDYDDEKGEAAAAALRALGVRAAFQHCDVSQRDEVKAAVAACIEQFGAIDLLVNNAYRGRGPSRIEGKSDEAFLDAMTVCLMAAKWSMEAAFLAMRARRWGRIINIASLNGVNAHMGTAEYNAGKEALRAYTRTAAREWARFGICANIICPAAISSNFRRFEQMQPELAAAASVANPMGRMGDPEADIGGVALFLASEDARYVTGNTLFVDGGAHINGVAWVPDLGPES
jgi:NAD(P)-dependent dehydrogenase (short-subunit alcohol dehydrogenase family)